MLNYIYNNDKGKVFKKTDILKIQIQYYKFKGLTLLVSYISNE